MDNVFDVIVLGTGLSESIAAAALAKAGLKVAHVDPNPYYGADEATLTLDELVQWAETHSTNSGEGPVQYRVDYLSPHCPPNPKQYSISLTPSIIPSVGPFMSSLIASGVARYGSYKLLGPMGIYRNGQFQSVPQNRESIFQDRSISLVEKRRLMRFLTFASGEFETSPLLQGKEEASFDNFLSESFGLNKEISRVVMFSLASCNFSGESTLGALHRVRSCLKSAGRYGSSPFLVGYYGGSGEISQGFCRATAVSGGVYILGRKISNLVVNGAEEPKSFSLELEDIPDPLQSSCVLSSVTCVPRVQPRVNLILSNLDVLDTSPCQVHAVARCIAIVQGTITLPHLDDNPPAEGQSDSFLVVFPPGSLDDGSLTSSVTLLTAGAGTMSAPMETGIIHLSMPLDEHEKSSRELLHPYLARILDVNPTCLCVFQLFYMQYFAYNEQAGEAISSLFVSSPLQPNISQVVDQAACNAEKAFRSITKALGLETTQKEKSIWRNGLTDNDHNQGY